MEKIKRIHVYVSGRVQGVFFRAYVKSHAERLNITGWVKNLPDKRVEILAEGTEKNLEEFIRKIKKGPILSKVKDIQIKSKIDYKEFSSFEIIT